MRRRNFLAVGGGLTATINRWRERRSVLDQPASEILLQELPDPEEEFLDDEHIDLERTSGTLAIDSETGVLRFGSDGNDETVTAIGGYLAADALVPGETWDGAIDDDNRIGTDVVADVDMLAFTPESFEGIALRATDAIDLYVDGVLVAGDAAQVRYAITKGVFEVEPVRPMIDDTWPQFQFDTANTGTPQPPESPPTTALDQKWHVEFGGIGGSSPAVADGTVYIGMVHPDGVFALNAETGDIQWDFQTEANVEGAPAVADDTVYIGSLDGNVYALAADSEEERWRFETDDEVWSSPAVAHDLVYVGSNDNHVYALDSAGEEEWRFETGDAVRSSPAVADDTVYVGSDDGNVYALDAESGDERWSAEINLEIFSSPAVVDDTVYVGSMEAENSGAVSALDAKSGDEDWRFETDEVWSSPAVAHDLVYVGSNDNHVYALDSAGEEEWRFETGDAVRGSPAVVDDTVYVGSDDGNVYALDAESGDERDRFDTDGSVIGSPAIANSTVYVASAGSDQGNVYAIVEGEEDIRHEVTVQPGTRLLFEADIENPDSDWDVEWQVDGERAFFRSYPGVQTIDYIQYLEQYEADYFSHSFESTGTYEVTAFVFSDPPSDNRENPDYEQAETIRWMVDVTSDGMAPPSVTAVDPDPDEPITVDRDEPFEVSLEITSPDSDLDRAVWWISQADRILGFHDLNGTEDTATLSVDEDSHCHTCEIHPWVITEDGLLTWPDYWEINHRTEGRG